MSRKVSTRQSPIENHPIQKHIWNNRRRFSVWVAGRRIGKTTLEKELLAHSSQTRKGLYWYVGPTRGHAKELMWEELKDTYKYYGWKYSKNEVDLSITRTLTQCRTVLKSGDTPARLIGKGLNGILFDEMSDIKPECWFKAARPALSDKLGWAFFAGTPKGYNYFYELYNNAKTSNDWVAFTHRTIDSPFFQTPEGLAEIAAARQDLDEKTFKQEYEASFETFAGRVCYAFDRLHNNTLIEYDPNLTLYVGQDFNRTPMSSCLFQLHAGRSIQFGELSLHTSSTDEVCRVLKERFPNWKNHGVIFRPDATGNRKTSNSSHSDFEIIKQHGFKIEASSVNPNRIDRWASVNRAFERGQSLINVKNCPRTVKDLESVVYRPGTSEPDTSDALSGHLFDAHGYFIHREFPIKTVQPSRQFIF